MQLRTISAQCTSEGEDYGEVNARNEALKEREGPVERLCREIIVASEHGALTAASDEQLLAVARAALRLADVAARRLMGSCAPR